MAHITPEGANAWADQVKLNLGTLDSELESSISEQVLASVSQAYNTSSWMDSDSTPSLVQKVIAMKYVGWFFQRTYSEDSDISTYGIMLIAEADKIIAGIANGALVLPDVPAETSANNSIPDFYPTDASSLLQPTTDDPSLGGPVFSLGMIW